MRQASLAPKTKERVAAATRSAHLRSILYSTISVAELHPTFGGASAGLAPPMSRASHTHDVAVLSRRTIGYEPVSMLPGPNPLRQSTLQPPPVNTSRSARPLLFLVPTSLCSMRNRRHALRIAARDLQSRAHTTRSAPRPRQGRLLLGAFQTMCIAAVGGSYSAGSLARKKAITLALKSRWKARRSKLLASLHSNGGPSIPQGVRNEKCCAPGTA